MKRIENLPKFKSNLKVGVAVMVALALVLSIVFVDMPSASATSYGDIKELCIQTFADYDVIADGFFEDSITSLYEQGYTSLLCVQSGSYVGGAPILLMFQGDVKFVRARGGYYGIGANDGANSFNMSSVYALTYYSNRWGVLQFAFSGTPSLYSYDGLSYSFFSSDKTSLSLVSGTFRSIDVTVLQYSLGVINGFTTESLIYSNIEYWGTDSASSEPSWSVHYEPNVLSPEDTGSLTLKLSYHASLSNPDSVSEAFQTLRIFVDESIVEDTEYSTWDISIVTITDLGSYNYNHRFSAIGWNNGAGFIPLGASMGDYRLRPLYFEVPVSDLYKNSSKATYEYISKITVTGTYNDGTTVAFYLYPPFVIFGDIPDNVSSGIFDDRDDGYVNPYSTVVELSKGNYLVEFSNGGIDMTDWDNVSSQYDGDIFNYVLQDTDLSKIPSWADLYFVQASTHFGVNYNVVLSNIKDFFTQDYGSISLLMVSNKNQQEALAEVMSTGIADISDVIFVVYENSQMNLFKWEGYFTHRFYTRKLDYDVIDAINGISPQLGGILTASENEYRLFDSYYQYLDSYFKSFDANLYSRLDRSNSLVSSVDYGIQSVDDSLSSVVTRLDTINSTLGGTLTVSDSASHNLLSAINTGIANLEISLTDGVSDIVDAINAIDISVGDITIPGMPDYSADLAKILNAIQYKKAVGVIPYHDWYSDNAVAFNLGLESLFGTLGVGASNGSFDDDDTSGLFTVFGDFMSLFDWSETYSSLDGDGVLDSVYNPFSTYFGSSWNANDTSTIGGN